MARARALGLGLVVKAKDLPGTDNYTPTLVRLDTPETIQIKLMLLEAEGAVPFTTDSVPK